MLHSKEFSGNQGKHQNFDPTILPYKFGLIFMGMKQKNSKWPTQKTEFFKIANSQNFFVKKCILGQIICHHILAYLAKRCIDVM